MAKQKTLDLSSDPPPQIYSVQNEYANPTAPDPAVYVPTDDVFLAVPWYDTINSIQQVAERPIPYTIYKDPQPPLNPQPFICPPNYVNFNGQCVPAGSLVNNVPILTECQSSGDCPSGYICVNGTCVSAQEADDIVTGKKTSKSDSSNEEYWIFGIIAAIAIILAFIFILRRH